MHADSPSARAPLGQARLFPDPGARPARTTGAVRKLAPDDFPAVAGLLVGEHRNDRGVRHRPRDRHCWARGVSSQRAGAHPPGRRGRPEVGSHVDRHRPLHRRRQLMRGVPGLDAPPASAATPPTPQTGPGAHELPGGRRWTARSGAAAAAGPQPGRSRSARSVSAVGRRRRVGHVRGAWGRRRGTPAGRRCLGPAHAVMSVKSPASASTHRERSATVIVSWFMEFSASNSEGQVGLDVPRSGPPSRVPQLTDSLATEPASDLRIREMTARQACVQAVASVQVSGLSAAPALTGAIAGGERNLRSEATHGAALPDGFGPRRALKTWAESTAVFMFSQVTAGRGGRHRARGPQVARPRVFAASRRLG